MPQLSAVIITRNEQFHIARAVRSLECTDEVLVVDCGSEDSTCQVATDLGARVIRHPWEGFVKQKNFAATQARHDWILSLDADEELNPRLQQAIREWKNSEPRAAGYRFRRRAYYLGRWIRHSGWYPDWKLRLYDRRRGCWGDFLVHESVSVDGPVESLPGELFHYTCDTFQEHVRRVDRYTTLAAQEMFKKGVKSAFWGQTLLPWWAFGDTYFRKLGILDGYQGLLIAFMASFYVFKKYAKLGRLLRGGKL